eukprot:gnl/TRDRNA2_/TRDRNA2_85228_c0_seq1.p1 gnl/TRDRNA2_/TRDRNA2_85228_c0~~gnl/TRDRNA2_/TRDRNA2_85228_c0_seq1.p1  ORF type:complete len:525 (+),score=70.67 gnl/TRDRNA2_/TRDRNA2_85228_c0_seq1:75-1649(+)
MAVRVHTSVLIILLYVSIDHAWAVEATCRAVNTTISEAAPLCEHAEESFWNAPTNHMSTLNLLQTRMSIHRAFTEPESYNVTKISFAGGTRDRPGGANVKRFMIPGLKGDEKITVGMMWRPTWQKTTRCTTSSDTSCTSCSSSKDCWTTSYDLLEGAVGRKTSRQMLFSKKESRFKRFMSTIHVQCASPTLGFSYIPMPSRGGTLRLLWDGIEITKEKGFKLKVTTQQHRRKGTLTWHTWSWNVSHPGGHDFTLEFTKNRGESSKAVMMELAFYMPNEYATCQDTKACLAMLGKNPASLKLRNSNLLQMQCLQLDLTEGTRALQTSPQMLACKQWRRCLRKGGNSTEKQLLTLLEAADVNEASDERKARSSQVAASQPASDERKARSSQVAASQPASDSHCIYPPAGDPESWKCDCMEEMLCRCREINRVHHLGGFSQAACLRAQLCLHSLVCESWKTSSCGEQVENVKQALQALPEGTCTARSEPESSTSDMSEAFLERSSTEGHLQSFATRFEETGASKRCK